MIVLDLANAKSEREVEKIISSSPFFSRGGWKSLGGIENNYGVVLGQQANPVASIVEKIVNSSDAILIKECKRRKIDPEGDEAPKSMFEAVENFFEIKDGDLGNLTSKDRKELAKNIRVIADGEKNEPNIIVADLGEGQHPEDFEGTFLSILKGSSRKRFIPFVQGRFSMGGTGVLPNCGKYGYELIISKKAPDICESLKSKKWGWSLIRKNSDIETYEYFVDEDETIPTFEIDNLSILPDGEDLPYGTFMKMYSYSMDTKSNITAEFWKKLNRFLFRSPLPVLLQETRDFASAVMQIVLDGNQYSINKQRDKIETEFTIVEKLGDAGIMKIRIYVFKDDLDPKENYYTSEGEAIFLTINGQTHASLGRSFIKNRARKPHLSRTLLVSIDCTHIDGTLQHDIFMPARDRTRDNEVSAKIMEDLATVLRNDDTLKRIDTERYQKLIEKSVDDTDFANKIMGKLINSNQDLIKYLKFGGKITHPTLPGKKEAIPTFGSFPTRLRIKGWKEEKGVFLKFVPINASKSRIDFELDAPNDYFDRDWAPGTLLILPPECFVGRKQKDGILTLRLMPKNGAKVGDEHLMNVEVTRYEDSALTVQFKIKYLPPAEPTPPGPINPREKPQERQDLGLPTPILVHKDEWKKYDWSGEDVVKIDARENGESTISELTVFINMDSDDLLSFKRRGGYFSKMVKAIDRSYEIGILLYSLTSYIELVNFKSIQDNQREMDAGAVVPIVMKGVSKALLDMIWNTAIREALQDT
ncbi:MAG: hypothetical protein ACYCSG_00635 [Thermoplasmataceae archaeon]